MACPERCPCGYAITHPMIDTRDHYSLPGWLLLIMGGTPRPVRVDYRCTRCETLLGTTSDAAVLRDYWQGGKR